MKKLVFIILMLVSISASANVTVKSLLGVCNAKDVMSQVTCHTYIVGVLDGLVMAAADTDGSNFSKMFCLPSTFIDTNNLVQISVDNVNALVKSDPITMNKDARMILYTIDTSMYKCQ